VKTLEDHIAGDSEYYEEFVDDDTEDPGEKMEDLAF
jgi:hypothetical protein